MIRYDATRQTLNLAVRDLLQGEDSSPGVYLPGRGQLGTQAHQTWQQQQRLRDSSYRGELFLKRELELDAVRITLQGRLDGLVTEPVPVVEELKSILLPVESYPPLSPVNHPNWFEQLEYYCWLAWRELELPDVAGRLVLLATHGSEFRLHDVAIDLPRVEQRLWRRLREIVSHQQQRAAFLTHRRRQRITFPFSQVRPRQDQLMEAVRDAAARSYHLVLQAPTGIGKTAATLVPALQQALLADKRVFVITPKNSGQQSYSDLIRLLNLQPGTTTAINCVTMPAREKICPAERYICDADYCPFLQDFQAALRRTITQLKHTAIVGEEELRLAAEQFRICPHEVALALSEERDVVIGDYNHVFSPASQIRRLFRTGQAEQFFLLVDEAHHFPARARSWFSGNISLQEVDNVIQLCRERESASARQPGIFGGTSPTAQLRHLFERFRDLCQSQDCFRTDRWSWQNSTAASFPADEWADLALELAQSFMAWMLHRKVSGSLLEKDAVAGLYYDLQYFFYLAGMKGDNFEQFVEQRSTDQVMRVLCLAVPRSVRDQITQFPTVLFFSATLPPGPAYLELAGLPVETPILELPAVFPAANRKVVIHEGIPTHWRQRENSLPQLAEMITTLFNSAAVNTAVFFPSVDYLQRLRALLPPDLPLLIQEAGQNNRHRAALLGTLNRESHHLLLAVSGGSFAEGIDLPG
ncbi:MAG: DEAD/DEAH box helicase family protein, partial [Candidatus Delongbacteria bacterium]|nr:DEAD/DEAH box helicase family protein [Candidatus Delongbacteria bacterium]